MKYAFLFVLIVTFASCRTSKKIVDTKKETVQVVEEKTSDSSGVKTTNKTDVTTINREDSSTIVIEFDTTGNTNPNKPEDYFSIDSSGKIVVKGKIKNIKAKGGSKTFIKDSSFTQTKDTAAKKVVEKKEVKTVKEEKHSTTTRKGIFAVAFWPLFIAAIIFFIFLYLKKRKADKVKSIIQ